MALSNTVTSSKSNPAVEILRPAQQYAINLGLQHHAYQNILLRLSSKYCSNLGICQNILGASSLPEGV